MGKFVTKHTPRPFYKMDYGRHIAIQPTTCIGAADLLNKIDCKESEDNASLFESAPLLLSTPIKAVESVDNSEVRTVAWDQPVPDWYHEAKAAIAAAGVVVEESNS